MSDWKIVPEEAASDWKIVDDAEEGGPESFLHPDKFKPSPQHRKFKNTGPMEQIRKDLDPGQYSLTEDLARAPAQVASGLRQMDKVAGGAGASALDKYTGGGLGAALRLDRDVLSRNPIARAVDEIPGLGPLIGKRGGETADEMIGQIEGYRAEHPTASMYTDIPGYMGGAPKAIAMGVERMIPQVVNPIARAARATVGAGLSSAGTAATESLHRAEGPVEAAKEAGRGYVGGTAVGAPLSVLGLMMRAASNTVLNSRGAKAREYLEARGQPLTAPDTSDAAIGAAAQRTDQAVKDRMAAYKQEVASGPYMEEISKVTPEQAGGFQEMTPVWENLAKASQDPANLQVADKLKTLANMLESRQMTTPSGDKMIFMTEHEVNGLRRSLAGISGVGETRDPVMSPLREAFHQVKGIVDEGPYAAANARNTAGMKDFNESLGMAGLDTSYDVDKPITGNLRVASQRQGQNTVTAGADTERLDLEAFKAKHPELANVIDAPEILRNQGDLAFHATGPSHGGLIDRVTGHMPIPMMLAGQAFGHGWQGAAAAAAALGYANRNALAGRVLYSPAQQAQIAAQMMLLGGVPALAAPGREVIPGDQ